MLISTISELRWANADMTLLDCVAHTSTFGPLPLSASASDPETAPFFSRAVAGEFGDIEPFVAPTPPPPPTVSAVSRAQMMLALLETGILDDVEAFVADADRAVQIEWAERAVFERSNGLLNAMAEVFFASDAQGSLDSLFGLAAAK